MLLAMLNFLLFYDVIHFKYIYVISLYSLWLNINVYLLHWFWKERHFHRQRKRKPHGECFLIGERHAFIKYEIRTLTVEVLVVMALIVSSHSS